MTQSIDDNFVEFVAYIYDQPDGDVVLVKVGGPAEYLPTDEVISKLLTGLDVPTSG